MKANLNVIPINWSKVKWITLYWWNQLLYWMGNFSKWIFIHSFSMLAEIFQQIEDWKIRTILNANIFLFFFLGLLNVNITKRFVGFRHIESLNFDWLKFFINFWQTEQLPKNYNYFILSNDIISELIHKYIDQSNCVKRVNVTAQMPQATSNRLIQSN